MEWTSCVFFSVEIIVDIFASVLVWTLFCGMHSVCDLVRFIDAYEQAYFDLWVRIQVRR